MRVVCAHHGSHAHRQVDWLSEKLREANFTVSAMHGDMPQTERNAIMAEFRSGARWVACYTMAVSIKGCSVAVPCI